MSISTEVITEPQRVGDLERAWEELLERASVSDPTLSPIWQKIWWDVFGPLDGRRLRVIALREGSRLVGVAPFLLRRHYYVPGVPVRRLELLASGEAQSDEIMSEYNGVIAERGREVEVARAAVAALRSPEIGTWDELVMPVLSPDNPMTYAFHRALEAAGHPSELEAQTSAFYIALPGTWEAYLAQLSSPSRYLVKRTLRDLDAWAGGEVAFEVVHDRAAFDVGRAILRDLHAQRWEKEVGPGGVFGSRRFTEFHDRAMRWLLDRGGLELAWLSARGQPIAALYNFVWGDKVYQYQGGRRMDLPKSIRAGIAVNVYAIQHAIERGRREYDFLGGDDRYKDQLSTAKRPLLRIRATRGPLTHLARRCAERTAAGARDVQRRLQALRARVSSAPTPRP